MKVLIRNRQQGVRLRRTIPIGSLKVLAEKILLKLGQPDVELGLILVNDRAIRRLNREYRGKDRPTDVLAFPMDIAAILKGPVSPPRLLGDVVISLETAREEDHGLYQEVGRLLIHGILHLLGFDHEEARDARRMRRKERELKKACLDG